MVRHIENGDPGGSQGKIVVQRVIPALPLLPIKRRSTSKKDQESATVENGIEPVTTEAAPSSCCGDVSDHACKTQFRGLGGNDEHLVDSPTTSSLNETSSSVGVAFSPLPSGASKSNNNTLTQGDSSRASSAPLIFKFSSDDPTPNSQQPLRTSVVELPAEASISRSSSLKISFLYQEDLDSASPTINPYIEHSNLVLLPKMSAQQATALGAPNMTANPNPNQAQAGGNAPAVIANSQSRINSYIPNIAPNLRPARIAPAAMISLSLHLLYFFNLKIQCDQQIMVDVPGAVLTQYYFDAHKMIISRSPMLALLMHFNTTNEDENGKLTLSWPTRFFNQEAFAMCLRHLYSDTVLSIDEIEDSTQLGGNQPISDWRSSQLMFTITYWLGGFILEAPAITHQAHAILHNLLNFDIIGVALAAATDLCDHQLYGGEHIPVDNGLQDDHTPLGHRRKMFIAAGKLGTKLKEMIFTFIATNIVFEDFQLDTTLHQRLVRMSIPVTRELRSHYSPHVPVQTLQFGQVPPQQAPVPTRPLSMKNRYTSYIMLNIPFPLLKEAVTIMRTAAKTDKTNEDISIKHFIQKVIAEREVRRDILNRSTSVTDAEQKANLAVWGVVGYEEMVVEEGGEETAEWSVETECSEEWEALLV